MTHAWVTGCCLSIGTIWVVQDEREGAQHDFRVVRREMVVEYRISQHHTCMAPSPVSSALISSLHMDCLRDDLGVQPPSRFASLCVQLHQVLTDYCFDQQCYGLQAAEYIDEPMEFAQMKLLMHVESRLSVVSQGHAWRWIRSTKKGWSLHYMREDIVAVRLCL